MQHQVEFTFRWGNVANAHASWILYEGRKIVDLTCPVCVPEVLDSNLATITYISRSSRDHWPTHITPRKFKYMIEFPNYDLLKVFYKGTSKLVTNNL